VILILPDSPQLQLFCPLHSPCSQVSKVQGQTAAVSPTPQPNPSDLSRNQDLCKVTL
jgi:hypothetical protein